MPKYRVRVASPTIYEIEADSEQEAINQAVELYKKEHKTWIDPAFQDAEEIT